MRLELVDVYSETEAPRLLYHYLLKRPSNINISHQAVPSFREHVRFMKSRPYKSWFLLRLPSEGYCGAINLTKRDEVGIFLLPKFQGRGLGTQAVRLLLARHPEVKRFLANISPRNPRSALFFESLRFKPIQNTYELKR